MPAVKKQKLNSLSQPAKSTKPYAKKKKQQQQKQQQDVDLPALPDTAFHIDYTALSIHEQHSKMARVVVQCFAMLRNERPTYAELDVAYRTLYPTSKVLSIRLYVQQWSSLAELHGVPSIVHGDDSSDCMYAEGEYHRVCRCSGARLKTRAVKLWIDESIPLFNTEKTVPPLSRALLPKPTPKTKVVIEPAQPAVILPPSPSPSIPSLSSAPPSLCESSEEDDLSLFSTGDFEQLPPMDLDLMEEPITYSPEIVVPEIIVNTCNDGNLMQEGMQEVTDKDLLDFLLHFGQMEGYQQQQQSYNTYGQQQQQQQSYNTYGQQQLVNVYGQQQNNNFYVQDQMHEIIPSSLEYEIGYDSPDCFNF